MKENTQFDLAMELLITNVMMVKRLWRMFIRRVTSMNNTKRTGKTDENYTPIVPKRKTGRKPLSLTLCYICIFAE